MKYLFFDCEFASSAGGKEKICEFGYVITDERFDKFERDNIIINPNIKDNEWDWYALKKILTRKKEDYLKQLPFPAFFPKIKRMIEEADMIFGHSISSDVHAINCECERFSLEAPNYKFFDIKEMYKVYSHSTNVKSIENTLNELNIQGDPKTHDAEADAFNTMLIVKTMLANLNIKINNLIALCPSSEGDTFRGIIETKKQNSSK